MIDVGLRSAYVASWYAAPLLLRAQRGLIAFTSSPGSVCYMHGPAYGAQKAGVDKMAADMAVDFAGTPVCTVSIWMGVLLTDRLRRAFDGRPDALAAFAEHAETPSSPVGSSMRSTATRVAEPVRAHGHRRRDRRAVRDHRLRRPTTAVTPRRTRRAPRAQRRGGSVVRQQT